MKHCLAKVLKAFGFIKVGDLGGWLESEEYLSQVDNARVFGNDWVSDNARVSGNAWVSDNAWVSGDVYSIDPSQPNSNGLSE